MDLQQQRILDHLVDYWWEQFNLVPAADIAEVFNIPEAEALTVLEEMARAGVVELHRRQAGPADPAALTSATTETFRATYVLPTRSILKTRFEAAKEDFGPYKNILVQGMRQETLFRFRPVVLDECRHNQQIDVRPDLVITTPAAMVQPDVHPVYVRYRWATGPSGQRYIMVNLWDLAELSREDQAMWARHEIRELREDAA